MIQSTVSPPYTLFPHEVQRLLTGVARQLLVSEMTLLTPGPLPRTATVASHDQRPEQRPDTQPEPRPGRHRAPEDPEDTDR